MKEAQEKRDKKRDQRQRRKEATSTPATFSCNQCVNFFSSQKDLDNHMCKYRTFICQICQHFSKTLPELDFHKDIMHDTTPRKLPATHPEDEEMVCGWRHRMMVEDQQKELDQWRDVKDMAAREKWAEYWAAWVLKNHWTKKKKKETRGNTTQRRKLKQQLEMTRTKIQTMYNQKKAAVRIHYMNLHERSSREPTRKETTEKKKKKKITNTYIFFQHCICSKNHELFHNILECFRKCIC